MNSKKTGEICRARLSLSVSSPLHPPPSTPPENRRPSSRGWAPLVLLPLAAVALAKVEHWPRWGVMWALATAIYFACKWLTWRRTPHQHASPSRQLFYFFAWPGMDAIAFFNPHQKPAPPRLGEWFFGIGKFSAGIIILFVLPRHLPAMNDYWLGWVGMIGISMCLHFGSFHVLSCVFRSLGIEARPLMNWPLIPVRLSEYWGRQWNTAFRDLTHRFLFKPLSRRLGGRAALWIGFLISGLVHDAVISIPAGGGYGGPTLFFLIQAMGLSLERTPTARRFGIGSGFRGWFFTMAFLLIPARLLFHEPFVTRVIVPFMHAIGAI